MRYRVENLGMQIKYSKVHLYEANFFELKKNFKNNIFEISKSYYHANIP